MKVPNRSEGARMRPVTPIATLTPLCISAFAQEATPPPAPSPRPLLGDIAAHPNWPAAKPADVNSVDAIISAVYNVISGPRGQSRDWDRMRSLFLPDARLIPARAAKDTPHTDAVLLSIDDYIPPTSVTMTSSAFFPH